MNVKNRTPKNEKDLLKKIDSKYKNFALSAYNNKRDVNVDNSSMIHALFLSKLLISLAQTHIKIFSGTIAEAFFENPIIIKSFEEKYNANKDLKVDVVVEKYEKTPKWMKDRNIEVRNLEKDIEIKNHMLLIDNIAFRVEEEHDKDMFKNEKNVWTVKATANFNNRKDAKLLNKVYDDLILPNSRIEA